MHLEPILAETRRAVAARKRIAHLPSLEALAAAHRPRGFAAALRRKSESGPAIIAEIKRASPSVGLIVSHLDPAEIARQYQAAGANAISVLTEADHFLGALPSHVARLFEQTFHGQACREDRTGGRQLADAKPC